MASAGDTAVKQNNKQRILEATIQLMNEQGGAVGTSQIADHLGISPGNLYYHFRNREEILRELFERLVQELDEVLRVKAGEPIPVPRLVACYTGGTRVLWRYRFFFASAVDFIGRDPWLAQRYLDFSERSQQYMRLIIQSAMKDSPGAVKANARQTAHLAETMWVLWVSWPRYSELARPGRDLGEADIGHGLEQIAFVLAPYLSETYYKQVLQRVHRFVQGLEREAEA
jgi:AcrR family transcriptional regulator